MVDVLECKERPHSFLTLFARNMKGIFDRQWNGKKCEVETVRKFTYLGDRVIAVGGCEVGVTKAEKAVYVSCVRPAILYGNEAWCLKESEILVL